jgi:hypothetical protein
MISLGPFIKIDQPKKPHDPLITLLVHPSHRVRMLLPGKIHPHFRLHVLDRLA